MNKVALITGAARRIGAAITERLHAENINVIVHYHHSQEDAEQWVSTLNKRRPNSAAFLQGDIRDVMACQELVLNSHEIWGRLDILINNASTFYPTPIEKADEKDWEDLFGSNVKGPFFLSQAAYPYLAKNEGTIINIVDIHANKPLKNYPVYCMAKASLAMMTKSLARELGPSVRVNGVAPGAILWPEEENALSAALQQQIIDRTCLKRQGTPKDLAETVWFLVQSPYITGQIIAVDGGRSV